MCDVYRLVFFCHLLKLVKIVSITVFQTCSVEPVISRGWARRGSVKQYMYHCPKLIKSKWKFLSVIWDHVLAYIRATQVVPVILETLTLATPLGVDQDRVIYFQIFFENFIFDSYWLFLRPHLIKEIYSHFLWPFKHAVFRVFPSISHWGVLGFHSTRHRFFYRSPILRKSMLFLSEFNFICRF